MLRPDAFRAGAKDDTMKNIKKRTVEMKLTKEQIKKLDPLLKMAEKNPKEMIILAQGYPEHGVAIYKVVTPDEVIDALNNSENRIRPINPRVWGQLNPK